MIEVERLMALAFGELRGEEERAVEEHVLACGECSELLAGFVRIGIGMRALLSTGHGPRRLFVTRSMAERLRAGGFVTREYVLTSGVPVPCTVDAKDVFICGELRASVGDDVVRVDAITTDGRYPDIPFDRDGVVLIAPGMLLRHVPTLDIPLRLVAVTPTGEERTVGDYTFSHTAWNGRT